MDEGSADVGFQAFELEEQVLVVEAERGGGGVDAWVGGDLLEAAQPLPAMAFAFGGVPDVGGQVGMGAAVDAVAGGAGWSAGDGEPVPVAADGFAGDAELGIDIAVGALAGLDPFAQPFRVDGPAGFVADEPDSVLAGVLGEQLAVDAGFGLDGGQVLARVQVLALEEVAGE